MRKPQEPGVELWDISISGFRNKAAPDGDQEGGGRKPGDGRRAAVRAAAWAPALSVRFVLRLIRRLCDAGNVLPYFSRLNF